MMRLVFTCQDVGALGQLLPIFRYLQKLSWPVYMIASPPSSELLKEEEAIFFEKNILSKKQLFEKIAPQAIFSGICAQQKGIDAYAQNWAKQKSISSFQFIDFWGEYPLCQRHSSQILFVPDLLGKSILEELHDKEKIFCVGSPKHQALDLKFIKKEGRLIKKKYPEIEKAYLIGAFFQYQEALFGHNEAWINFFTHIPKLLNKKDIYLLAKRHPKFPQSSDILFKKAREMGIRILDLSNEDIFSILAITDLAVSCFSTVNVDYLQLCRLLDKRGSSVFLHNHTGIIRDVARLIPPQFVDRISQEGHLIFKGNNSSFIANKLNTQLPSLESKEQENSLHTISYLIKKLIDKKNCPC